LFDTIEETRRGGQGMKTRLASVLAMGGLPGAALAAEAAAGGSAGSGSATFFAVTVFTAGVGLAISTLCAALGQGKIGAAAMEAIARQPEAAGKVQTAMLLGLAFIESLVIYVLLIAFILLFANPFRGAFGG
jgi:F-type H+-transporting ATPase subunit c